MFIDREPASGTASLSRVHMDTVAITAIIGITLIAALAAAGVRTRWTNDRAAREAGRDETQRAE